jgi:pimeloyl-ACP methyl ester carboxylesterase
VAGSAAGPAGEQRLLVLPTTWGPRPWPVEEIRREAIEASDAWIRRSSFGKAWLTGSVAPWLEIEHRADDCDPVRLATKARAAATGRGIDLRAYDRLVYLHPRGGCPWSGLAGTDDLWLNGALRWKVVVHELGHTWGLDHANALECGAEGCRGVEYGDPYSPMGRGDSDFTAFEKFRLGWISDVLPARSGEPATVELGPLERPTALPQAFVARSAAGQFWLEYRSDPGAQAGGVVVHADATPSGRPFSSQPNLLVADAAAPGRSALAAGERFAVAGSFAVVVTSLAADSARFEFAWTDETPPRAPAIRVPAKVRAATGRVVVRWRGADTRGSGLSHFDVSLAGRTRRVEPDVLGLEQRLSFSLPAAGRHTVTVTAVDRAGNRSSAARRFVVVGRRSARVFRARIDVGGYRLAVECRGVGTPAVVFDAGLNEAGGSWSPILPEVARLTRACAYDRAGLGASERRRGRTPATSGTIVDELRTLLRRAGIAGQYVLVGHSFGGVNMHLYGTRHAAETAGLVFVDAADAEALGTRGVGSDGPEPVDFRPAADELRGTRLGATPTIVLFSVALPDRSAELARRSSNSSLVFAPGSGHHIHQTRPRLVVEAIRQVVASARTGARLAACRETPLSGLGGVCTD